MRDSFVFGAQSFGVGPIFRRTVGRRTVLTGDTEIKAIVLAEVESDRSLVRRRDYDYAPGLALSVGAGVQRPGQELLSLRAQAWWLRSVYPSAAMHVVTTARLKGSIPVAANIHVGGEGVVTWRRSAYPEIVRRRSSELRAFVARPL
jgi:hypothetical protein